MNQLLKLHHDFFFFKIFFFQKAWFEKSKTNICYVSYAFEDTGVTFLNSMPRANEMRKTGRMEVVAQDTKEFVKAIMFECDEYRKKNPKSKCLTHAEQIKVVGYGFGAHVAAYFCRQLHDDINQTVPFLLGKIYECNYLIFFCFKN